jgi:lipopolysaccharide/colanic/teichoic acid biosynthesis glycosyltransferase
VSAVEHQVGLPEAHPADSQTAMAVRYLAAKRVLDVVIASVTLILAVPVFALIAIAIVLDSRGPVFFTQERIGARPARLSGKNRWQRRRFRIVKFRTMVAGADHSHVHREFVQAFVAGELPPDRGDATPYKLRGDARITRVGRLLRATSLDELPQLFNVLVGTMSLVGPRPVPPYEVEAYEERHMARLEGMPGITGLWQVEGRGTVGFEQMVDMDVEYLRAQSLWLDLQLLARTVPCAFSRKGAK